MVLCSSSFPSSFGDFMLKSETTWLNEKSPCDRCDTEEDIGYLFPLDDGTEICECCAIDIGWIEAPQGLILNPEPPVTPDPYEWDDVSDIY